ncbi:phage tail protein [Weissella oryzae SG25]|uniref:site-specific DNA-methyltransferase (adenine-specific) n=1 Tax=Weissella oryzae (strain DSM 25784 / JCM 18191 / LMG 30913 / SG25) TaxID=1329250 RepID=A0A069CXD1_WEIOS|nr:DNA adenine methylase [Weissella oryzae]GAK32027.1 phage tail protein [Weissella oryzae SG25]
MELVLDEKKIRKGKPIGLPYVGSKKKISKKIVEIIKQNFGTDKPVYDIFGGGGAITAELILNGLDVHYNDLDKSITDMFQRVISQDREWIKTLIVSREEFVWIRDKQDKTVDDELKLLVNSFGNNRKGYLYGVDIADDKYELAVKIISNHDMFSGYKQTDTYKNRMATVQQLQQLGQLQQLWQLQQVNDVVTTNLDYKNFSNITESILYLDPPYENSVGYNEICPIKIPVEKYQTMRDKLVKLPSGTKLIEDCIEYKLGTSDNNRNRMYYKTVQDVFDSSAFYDWAFSMSKNNVVLISSYEISDDRFEPVFEFKTARSTFQGGTGKRYEKLFMVKQ